MSHGLIIKKKEPESYVFGRSPLAQEVLREDGQWDDFLPEYESQYNHNFDTFGCPIFGTLNAVEILMRKVFGIKANYSERYHYNVMPLRPPGGDPHEAAESVRKHGMVDQADLPMTETFDEYVIPYPMLQKYLDLGARWLETHDFGHEWVWRGNVSQEGKFALLRDALRYSPVCISVTAWEKGPDGLYIDGEKPNNHWCVLIGYRVRQGDGAFIPRVLDTYDFEIKELSPEHDIQIAKRYHLGAKVPKTQEVPTSWFQRIINFFLRK